MADIRNDQYLHRPGAGRGAITPADPLEVLLYGPDGQPISRNARVIHTVSVSGIGPGGVRNLGVTAHISTTADPLDISPYVTKHVEVQNTGPTEITVASLRFYKQTGSQDSNAFYYEANVEIQLPAGARVTLTPQEVPVLRDPHIAMILRIVNSVAGSGGAAVVTFMGGFA